MPRLTEQRQQEIIRYIEADNPLSDKFRFLFWPLQYPWQRGKPTQSLLEFWTYPLFLVPMSEVFGYRLQTQPNGYIEQSPSAAHDIMERQE